VIISSEVPGLLLKFLSIKVGCLITATTPLDIGNGILTFLDKISSPG